MGTELVKTSSKGVAATGGGPIVPAIIADAGEKAGKRFVEFLTATIRNGNTRQAYARAIGDFFAWCERHRLTLTAIEPASALPSRLRSGTASIRAGGSRCGSKGRYCG